MVKKHVILNFLLLLLLGGHTAVASDPNNNNAAPENKVPADNEHETEEIKGWMEKGDASYQAAEQGNDTNIKQALYYKAFRCYQKAAAKGHARAQYNLGVMYEQKLVLPSNELLQSDQLAIRWFQEVAKYGNDCTSRAQYNLGVMYQAKRGIPKEDYQEADKVALKWFQEAARRGQEEAYTQLNNIYAYQVYVQDETEKKVRTLRSARNKMTSSEAYSSGWHYFQRGKKEKDSQEQKKLYNQAFSSFYKAAHEEDHAESQYKLGVMYANGLGIEKDEYEAIQYWKRAANKGHSGSQNNLGVRYANGRILEKNEKEALKLWKLAVEQGDVEAHFNLGMVYKSGTLGEKPNLPKAVKLLKIAAFEGYIHALTTLAEMYSEGLGVSKDNNIALWLYQYAAARGDASAQLIIGYTHLNGTFGDKEIIYTEENHEKAIFWLQKAAEQGDKNAIIALLRMGITTTNISKNKFSFLPSSIEGPEKFEKNKASDVLSNIKTDPIRIAESYIKLEREVSETEAGGDGELQMRLGALYARGNGVIKNEIKALQFFKKARQLQGKTYQGYVNHLGCDPKKTLDASSLFYFSLLENYGDIHKKKTLNNELSKIDCLFNIQGVPPLESWLDKIIREVCTESPLLSPVEGFYKYREKAIAQDINAQVKLASLFMLGIGAPLDVNKAFEWLTEASQRGDSTASKILGFTYQNNYLISKHKHNVFFENVDIINPEFRDKVSEMLSIAHTWIHTFHSELGNLYADGKILRPSNCGDQEAFSWLAAASNKGNVKAQYRLGRMYEYGWGTPKDGIQAVACYKRGALQWYGPAQKALAEAYRYGRGIEKSIFEALRWYRRAAKRGDAGATAVIKEIADKENMPEAIYALAKAHEEGWGIARDEEEAYALYSQAARQGYRKAQYISAVKALEGKMSSDDDLEPLSLLTTLAGREARVKYLELKGKELSRKERKALKELPEQGYYKAQHKLAELNEISQVIPLNTAKAQENAYLEAIRLYEVALKAVKKDGKLVLMASLDKARSALRKLQQLGDEDKLEFDHPGFKAFLEFSSSTKKLDPDFRQQLAFVFTQARSLDTETRTIIDNTLEGLLRFPANSKPSWGVLGMLKAYVKLLGSSSKEQESLSKEIVVSFPHKLSLLHPLWRPIHHPDEVAPKRLKVSTRMLYDPRVEIFNTCFREFEEDYNKDTYEGSVQRILSIFERLHTPEFFGSAAEDLKETSSNLRRLITRDHEPTNRFAHRLVRIADILQKQFKEAKVKRDWDTLRALKETLAHWAVRGQGDCRMGGEDELNRFYIGTLINTKSSDSAALAQEDWTLEMQVAISLAQFRLKLIDELVIEQDNDRIHSVKHLEKKVRLALGLLGDAENYVDSLEHTVPLKYRQMSSYEIIEVALQKYTPDTMAAHLRDAIDHPHKDVNVGKAISYEKIYQRLRFQCLREEIKKKGLASLLSNELFHNEDYLLDHCTREEFTHQVLLASSLQQVDPNNNSNDKRINIPDWDSLKGMSTMQAKEQLETAFYDDSYTFTPKAAKALLYGMGYIEEE